MLNRLFVSLKPEVENASVRGTRLTLQSLCRQHSGRVHLDDGTIWMLFMGASSRFGFAIDADPTSAPAARQPRLPGSSRTTPSMRGMPLPVGAPLSVG